jgi:hypothetical protein
MNETRKQRLIDSLIDSQYVRRTNRREWRAAASLEAFVLGMAAGVVACIIVIGIFA